MPLHELYRAAVDPLRAVRLLSDGEFVTIEFVSADRPRPLFALPGIAATPDNVREAARVVGGLVLRMRTVLQGVDAVKALAAQFPGFTIEDLSLRQDHNGFRAFLLLKLPDGAHHRITVDEENIAAFGDARIHQRMLEKMRRDVFPALAAQGRPEPAPGHAKGAPTALNLYAMSSALKEHGGVIPDRVPPTDLPHLRRCIAAGLLERRPSGGWVPTAAGREAMEGAR